MAGTITNSGPAASQNVRVERKLVDRAGKVVASGSTLLGPINPRGRHDYRIAVDLGAASYSTVDRDQITLTWTETHYFFWKSTQTLSGRA
jgi:hypothetical protein